MQLKNVRVGGVVTPNNVFLAPLAGYTNAVFRQTCQKLGAGLTFTEMVSAKGLCYSSRGSAELLQLPPEYSGIKACQLFGSEPYYMEKASCSEEVAPFAVIDINMGCPVPKIFKNGEGSALLSNIPLAQKIVEAAKKSGKAVTVKFRTGIEKGKVVAVDFAKAMEQAGADMLTVHGRTREQFYSGEVDYATIAAVKKAVKIPVIANGGIFTAGDADKLIKETGADGVMLARGAMYNPFLFAEITNTPVKDKKALIKKQLDDTFALYDARFATVFMRKMLGFYIKGQPNAAAMRVKFLTCTNKAEIEKLLNQIEL